MLRHFTPPTFSAFLFSLLPPSPLHLLLLTECYRPASPASAPSFPHFLLPSSAPIPFSHAFASHFFTASYSASTLLTSVRTMLGSASVDTSPSWSDSRQAIFRSTRRMILPERVLGKPGVQTSMSGVARPAVQVKHEV